MKLIIAYGVFLVCSLYIMESDAYWQRGEKFRFLFPTTKKPGKPEPIVRRPRHHKWKLNEIDEEDDHMTTATPKSEPVTKSQEQIQAELVAEMKRANPKGFLMGDNEDKNKDKLKIFGTEGILPTLPTDTKIKQMEKKLKSLQTSCSTNADCTNRTCCLIDQQGAGKCILKPHKIGQTCTDMCACVNDMECKWKETDQDKLGVIKTIKKCSKKTPDVDSKEFEQELIAKLRKAVKKTKGCPTCRV